MAQRLKSPMETKDPHVESGGNSRVNKRATENGRYSATITVKINRI